MLNLNSLQRGAGLDEDYTSLLINSGFRTDAITTIVNNLKQLYDLNNIEDIRKVVDYTAIEFPNVPRTIMSSVVDWVKNEIVKPMKDHVDKSLLQLIVKAQQGDEESKRKCVGQYKEAYETLLKENSSRKLNVDPDWEIFKQELMNVTTIPNSGVKFGHPSFGKGFKSHPIPLDGGKLAKQELPYFSQFHYKMEKDDELFKTLLQKKRSSIMFIGASGGGKTSTSIRLLSKNPGIILTCTHEKEITSGLTTDDLMSQMYAYLNGLRLFELYGCVEQVINMVIICRLIYILKLIENAKENSSVFEPFGGILPYLAYMQANGKTNTSAEAFRRFRSRYLFTNPEDLYEISGLLITEIMDNLNNNTSLFKIEAPIEKFIAIIDEANVYTCEEQMESNLSNLIGLNSSNRGLLTIISQAITKTKLLSMSIFCGTNFSVNVSPIIQSEDPKINIAYYYDFGLISHDDLIEFLEKHIMISSKEKRNLKLFLVENDYKYFRRRVVTLALEELGKDNKDVGKGFKLVHTFKKSIQTSLQYCYYSMMKKYFEQSSSLQDGIRDALVNYIAHYKFPFLGSNFKVENEVADALLNSAFSSPEAQFDISHYTFSPKDCLGVEVAFIVLDMIIHSKQYKGDELSSEEKQNVMKYVIREKFGK